jgi:hypothetical protein
MKRDSSAQVSSVICLFLSSPFLSGQQEGIRTKKDYSKNNIKQRRNMGSVVATLRALERRKGQTPNHFQLIGHDAFPNNVKRGL